MSVFRTTVLPTGPARGRLIVTESVTAATRAALRAFGGADGRHEGLVFWAGCRTERDILVLAALVPRCAHTPMSVMIDEHETGRLSRSARAQGLAIVTQVHSHPGDDTRHSQGDDRLILMPFDGMFSLVVGRYGDGAIRPEQGAGLHQFQDRRWVYIRAAQANAMVVVPNLIGEDG